MAAPHTFVLHNPWALGDTVCLSALVRDIHRAYPGKYRLVMSGHYKAHWKNSPHCTVSDGPSGQLVQLGYVEGIKAAGRGERHHFLSYFHKDFSRKTGLVVPVTEPRGEIFLSQSEKNNRPFPDRYWVVVAGGKLDMT